MTQNTPQSQLDALFIDTQLENWVRQALGFDGFVESVAKQKTPSYPPHTICRHKETKQYTITLALAGYDKETINIEAKNASIRITSDGSKPATDPNIDVLHRGIATRSFKFVIPMHESLEVTSATFENGLLTILVDTKPTTDKSTSIKIN